jgi:hypothetical protein
MWQNLTRRSFLKGTAATAAAAVLLGCGASTQSASATSVKFAVFSDPHLYDATTLGSGSTDFNTYLNEEGNKDLVSSVGTLTTVINNLSSQSLDFVIVPGDMTKDGELVDHQYMASMLSTLKASGKKVYVVPGNHDINNPSAMSYLAQPATSIAYTTPAQFQSIYANYGFNDAIYSDTGNSLSYIVEPVEGLWLFAIDSCKYSNNIAQGSPTTSGVISGATLSWLLARLADAKAKGKAVLAMMHHNVFPHWSDENALFPGFVVDNYANSISDLKSLSDNGMNVVFTGHFHANNIHCYNFGSSVMYDVETGSLVTYPFPYRTVSYDIAGAALNISTSTVTTVPYFDTTSGTFASYEQNFLTTHMTALTEAMLQLDFGVTDSATEAYLASLFVPAMMAHYAGNSKPSATTLATINAMMASGNSLTQEFGQVLYSLYGQDQSDVATHEDNNLSFTIGKVI